MKLAGIGVFVVVIAFLGCSVATPVPVGSKSNVVSVDPTPNIDATAEARLSLRRTIENRKEDVLTKGRIAKTTANSEPCATEGEIFTMEDKGEISEQEAVEMLKKSRDKDGCPIQQDEERSPIFPPTVAASSSSTIVDLVDTVGNVLDLYDDNEFAADATLTGKWVEMRGKVERVESVDGKIEVNLIGSQDLFRMNSLVCKVNMAQAKEAIDLRGGDVIVVTGKLLGVTGFTNVVAEPCKLP